MTLNDILPLKSKAFFDNNLISDLEIIKLTGVWKMGLNKVSKLDSKVLTDDIIDVKQILILLFGWGIIFGNYIGTAGSFKG